MFGLIWPHSEHTSPSGPNALNSKSGCVMSLLIIFQKLFLFLLKEALCFISHFFFSASDKFYLLKTKMAEKEEKKWRRHKCRHENSLKPACYLLVSKHVHTNCPTDRVSILESCYQYRYRDFPIFKKKKVCFVYFSVLTRKQLWL